MNGDDNGTGRYDWCRLFSCHHRDHYRESSLFYDYPDGFVEILMEGTVSLGAKHGVKVLMEDGNGERFRATDWGPDMTSRFDRLFTKEDLYYFLDQESNVRPANKRWILKLFPEQKEQIRSYLVKNYINFKVAVDLESLLKFCNNSTRQ